MHHDGQIVGRNNRAYALSLQADGKIIVAGSAVNAQDLGQVQVLRLIGDTLLEDGFEGLD